MPNAELGECNQSWPRCFGITKEKWESVRIGRYWSTRPNSGPIHLPCVAANRKRGERSGKKRA